MDLWGPSLVQSLQGKHYYVSFIDNAKRWAYLNFLHTKDETFRSYCKYEAWAKSKHNVTIKALHSDNSGEYTGKEFVLYLKTNGTCQKLTVHNTPQHNSAAKHYNHTVIKKVCAMLHSSGLPKALWAEAVCHAVWVLNRTSTKALDGMTPLEASTGKKPDLRGLRKWGEKVWVCVEEGNKLGGWV